VGEAVAVAVHLEDVDVVGELVENGAGQAFGTEHAGPLVERQVAGDDGRTALVALGEHLEQQLGAGLRQRHVAEFVCGGRPSHRTGVCPGRPALDQRVGSLANGAGCFAGLAFSGQTWSAERRSVNGCNPHGAFLNHVIGLEPDLPLSRSLDDES